MRINDHYIWLSFVLFQLGPVEFCRIASLYLPFGLHQLWLALALVFDCLSIGLDFSFDTAIIPLLSWLEISSCPIGTKGHIIERLKPHSINMVIGFICALSDIKDAHFGPDEFINVFIGDLISHGDTALVGILG